MELIGSLFLVLALALIVGLFIGRPFLLGDKQETSAAVMTAEQEREHTRSALLAERDRVLNSLQELDFDFALGKVPAEEYPMQRATLLQHGADVLRRLDQMQAAGSTVTAPASSGSVEDRIEAAVAARRADAQQRAKGALSKEGRPVQAIHGDSGVAVAPNKREDELENFIASRKRQRKETAAGFCPGCGKPVQKSDKFCSKCGASL